MPVPWSEVTVKEQREAFIRDYRLGYCSLKELAERFGISQKDGLQVDWPLGEKRIKRAGRLELMAAQLSHADGGEGPRRAAAAADLREYTPGTFTSRKVQIQGFSCIA